MTALSTLSPGDIVSGSSGYHTANGMVKVPWLITVTFRMAWSAPLSSSPVRYTSEQLSLTLNTVTFALAQERLSSGISAIEGTASSQTPLGVMDLVACCPLSTAVFRRLLKSVLRNTSLSFLREKKIVPFLSWLTPRAATGTVKGSSEME